LKLAEQHHILKYGNVSERLYWIARAQSYHGNSLGALSVGNHKARRAVYEPILKHNVRYISATNWYRDRKDDENVEDYITRKVQELDDMFREVGPKKVVAFVLEPISGAVSPCLGSSFSKSFYSS
jgi:adenosylmethionine-8-amino-7-oxononanoate aminotransferase